MAQAYFPIAFGASTYEMTSIAFALRLGTRVARGARLATGKSLTAEEGQAENGGGKRELHVECLLKGGCLIYIVVGFELILSELLMILSV